MARPRKLRKPIEKYNVCCDGNTEVLYFKRLEELVNHCDLSKRLSLNTKSANSGSPNRTVEVASRGNVYENKVAVFDHDGKDDAFKKALDLSAENNVAHGYSNICFELWLILHKTDCKRMVYKGADYWPDMQKVYGLHNMDSFDDCKNEKNCAKILSQISLDDVKMAIKRAKRIAKDNADTKTAHGSSKRGKKYYDNPDLSIHLVVEEMLTVIGVEVR